ncbi:MAG: Ribosomal protein [Candidatus Parcubacteria bacterium]
MPIKKSAEKALRQTKKRTIRNQKVKESIEFLRRSVRKALESKEVKEAQELAKAAIKAIDKASQNKVLKKNTAARMKSRLTLKVNAASKK